MNSPWAYGHQDNALDHNLIYAALQTDSGNPGEKTPGHPLALEYYQGPSLTCILRNWQGCTSLFLGSALKFLSQEVLNMFISLCLNKLLYESRSK